MRIELGQWQIVVEVDYEEEVCGNPITELRVQIHDWKLRCWRHLDTSQLKTLIEVRVPRLYYEGRCTEKVTVRCAER